MSDERTGDPTGDAWSSLADRFADDAYATVKGQVRTAVLDRQLREHLPPPPASVLDVGGGAGHQSFPLARAGYEVTVLDSSPAMLAKARSRLAELPTDARERVTLLLGDGERADAAVHTTFDAVLCHGVLGYLDDPRPMVAALCRCAGPGSLVSIMTGNANASAVRPALEQRWADAVRAFDIRTEVGVLGVRGRADTVDEVSALLREHDVEPVAWFGVWLFVDWLGFSGVELDTSDAEQVAAIVDVEFAASTRDPYRAISRVFHLVGRKGGSGDRTQ